MPINSPEEVASEMIPDAYNTPTLALKHVRGYTSYLSGKLKTIIDASIEDPQRRKALKDLIHNSLWLEGYEQVMEWAQTEVTHPTENNYFPFGDFNASYPGTEE